MKIPNKQGLQKISINHSSDIDFKDYLNVYKKSPLKLHSFLANDTTFGSGNLFHKIRDKTLQYRKQY